MLGSTGRLDPSASRCRARSPLPYRVPASPYRDPYPLGVSVESRYWAHATGTDCRLGSRLGSRIVGTTWRELQLFQRGNLPGVRVISLCSVLPGEAALRIFEVRPEQDSQQ